MCLKQGVLNKDTFETAKYFGMGEELAEKMDEYINTNKSFYSLAEAITDAYTSLL